MSGLDAHHGRWVLLEGGAVVDSDVDEAALRARHPEAPEHAFVPVGPPSGGYRVIS